MAWVRCCGGASRQPRGVIYQDGVLYKSFTKVPYKPSWAGTTPSTDGVITNSGGILKFTSPNANNYVSDPIDLTDVNSIQLNVPSMYGSIYIAVLKANELQQNYTDYSRIAATSGINSLNVATLTGEYRISVMTGSGQNISFSEIKCVY